MNLAYDLRYATDHFPGIGVYAHALGVALLGREGIESLTLIREPRARNTRFDLAPFHESPKVRWLDVDVPAMALHTALETGRLLERSDADAYLSPFWLRPAGTDLPCIVTVHDVLPLAHPEVMSWPRRMAYAWEMRRAAGAAAVLTVSRFSRDEIVRRTPIPAERIHVLPSGVSRSDVVPERPAGVPDAPFALTVAPNRPHKGLDTLAQVWRGFAGDAPLAWVAAGARGAGPPALEPPVHDVAGVHVLATVTQAELEWLYRNATLVLVPSRYEGFALPLLEAAARGTAVVASDLPPMRETGEGVAHFVPAGDVAAWAAAIRALAADQETRGRMAAAGPARAAAYGFEHHGERLEALLHEILAGVHS